MKILVVNWQDIRNPLGGGAEVHLHEIFSRIARLGHKVTLYCSSFPDAPGEETLNGIHIIRRGGRYLFNFRFLFAYLTNLRRLSFDILIDDMNKIPFFTPLYVKKPVYGVTHHLFGKSIFLETSFPVAAYVYVMEKLAVRLYKRRHIPFIVGSPSTHDELTQAGFRPENVRVINYAVDHSVHRPSGVPKSPTPLIGYFGRLKRYKSIDHLLQAIPRVRKEIPDIKVLIVGEGDDRPRLEAMSRELGLERAVEFTGYVPESRKIQLLQEMWFKVTTSSKEGWGLTVLEANACGTTVIASNVPGLRDAVRDNETGLLYTYGDVTELSDKILLLLKDRTLRERLAARALEWSRKFDWDIAAKDTLAVLKSRVELGGRQ
jgi:glycosyltransferase involved in cell wall biosynthesis